VNGRIGRLECRYELVGAARREAAVVSQRLVGLADADIGQALGQVLERALGDDEAVYVLRHVEARLALPGGDHPALVSALGERLARAVLRDLAEGRDVVRFESEADHAAHFLADLVDGNAWDRWIYGVFAPLRPLGTAGAARAVLLEHPERAHQVLSTVRRLGALDKVLVLVDDGTTLESLWNGHPKPASDPDADPARPVFLAVLRFADRLGLWAGERPSTDELWQSDAVTTALPITWRDRSELTASFVAMLSLLAARGHLRDPAPSPAAVEAALDELDWLDTSTVLASLARFGERQMLPSTAESSAPTSRQGLLLADLTELLERRQLRLAAEQLDSTGNALRILAALGPRWSDDAMARTMIERLVGAAKEIRLQEAGCLLKGDPEGALHALSTASRDAAGSAYRFLVRLGNEGVQVAAGLRAAGAEGVGGKTVDSPCAGVFLLVRAALDTRLPALAERTGYPAADFVLLSLALRWAGRAGSAEGRIDPGLALLVEPPMTLDGLRAAWRATPAAAHRRWRAASDEILPAPPSRRGGRALRHGRLGLPAADAALGRTALTLLHGWARWLRGFSASSAPFLLHEFIRRPGSITAFGDDLLVRLERRPLDVVLGVAGYTDELDLTRLGRHGRMRFELEEP
jgi:hypothetical protein